MSWKFNYSGITKISGNGFKVSGTGQNVGITITSPNTFPDDNFVLTKAPTSYITINYNNQSNYPTGSLKIVVLDETLNTGNPLNGIFPDNGGFQNKGILMDVQNDFRNVYWTITTTDTDKTLKNPLLWRCAIHRFAEWVIKNRYSGKNPYKNGLSTWDCKTSESRVVVKYVKEFYNNIKIAMPGLMAYRY